LRKILDKLTGRHRKKATTVEKTTAVASAIMELVWTRDGLEDYEHWERSDQAMVEKIKSLIKDIRENDPFKGLGKPECLKHGYLKGCWSRRITGEHRLVYRVTGKPGVQQLEILQCRYHYV
jgi:toxin YoeB